MLNSKKQINKGTVKSQTNKAEVKTPTKKKLVNKEVIWECLCCSCRVIGIEKPTACTCSNPNFVINLGYEAI